ncbi:GNAT family N-acetyltransferase [Treponema sp.]|uniref:GNAT family N-acetyltransferase n=1 Tax=Treponema sp. TaxID=166 RepID=UPI00298EA1C2|nr:GNAT family N-acetyltransferase [Treponema sp.]
MTTEAMKKILEYALSTRDVKVIAGTFAVENFGSRRVMEKLGMTYLEDTEYTKFDDSETFKVQTFFRKF